MDQNRVDWASWSAKVDSYSLGQQVERRRGGGTVATGGDLPAPGPSARGPATKPPLGTGKDEEVDHVQKPARRDCSGILEGSDSSQAKELLILALVCTVSCSADT